MFPVLTRLFDAAFRAGYYSFRDAARWVLDQIRTRIGPEVADALGTEHLQDAYISMSGRHKATGKTTPAAEVVAVDKAAIEKKLEALGFGEVMRPVSTTCADHMGPAWARIHAWDGAKWVFTSDWYQADESILKPLVKSTAGKYATEKKIAPRTPAQCQE